MTQADKRTEFPWGCSFIVEWQLHLYDVYWGNSVVTNLRRLNTIDKCALLNDNAAIYLAHSNLCHWDQ